MFSMFLKLLFSFDYEEVQLQANCRMQNGFGTKILHKSRFGRVFPTFVQFIVIPLHARKNNSTALAICGGIPVTDIRKLTYESY
jgi:hypothetical protein